MRDTRYTTLGRVLVVDDDPAILKYQSLVLTDQKFTCLVATSAEDALGILAHEHVEGLVCDLHMPGQSGLDLLRTLRSGDRWAALPVAIVTGDLMTPDEWQAEIEQLRGRLVADILRRDALIALAQSLVAARAPAPLNATAHCESPRDQEKTI